MMAAKKRMNLSSARPILLALIGSVVACGQPPHLAGGPSVDPWNISVQHDPNLPTRLEELRAAAGVPGIGAAILRNGSVSVAVAGSRRVDAETPLADGDLFHLGSDTKAMTASVVARLVDRGVLRWDETLAEAMPGVSTMDPAFRDVTLEMLMRHVAGLPQGGAFTPEFTAGFDETWPIDQQRAWMAERFVSRPPERSPGTRFAYSNYGYLILGHIVERATGKTWEDLVRQEVFEPLGMSACGFGPTATAANPDGNWAHDAKDGQYVPTEEDNPQLIGPAGTVHCALASWARFAAAHAHPESGRWITPASMSRLHRPFAVEGTSEGKDIGLGWGVTRTSPPRLTHSGSNGYNVAEIVVIPLLHAAVLVACNAGDERARRASSDVRDMLLRQLLDEPGGMSAGARRSDESAHPD